MHCLDLLIDYKDLASGMVNWQKKTNQQDVYVSCPFWDLQYKIALSIYPILILQKNNLCIIAYKY